MADNIQAIRDAQTAAGARLDQIKGFTDDLLSLAHREFNISFSNAPSFLLGDLTSGLMAALDAKPNPTDAVNLPGVTIPSQPVVTVRDPEMALPSWRVKEPVVEVPAMVGTTSPTPPTSPTVTLPDVPDMPEISIPAEPSLMMVDVPTFPGIPTFPVFSAILPDITLGQADSTMSWTEPPYQSDLLDGMLNTLLEMVTVGGTGLTVAEETRLFNQARDELTASQRSALATIDREYSSRGLTQPTGPMMAARRDVVLKTQIAYSQAVREITVRLADMAVENRRAALQSGGALVGMLINYQSAMAERALTYAREAAHLVLEVFRSNLQRENLVVQHYDAQFRAFETAVKIEVEKANLFKLILEEAQTRQAVNAETVKLYESRIQAVKAMVEVWNTQMKGVEIAAGVQKLKVEIAQAEVAIFTAQVAGNKLQIDEHDANIRGQDLKIRLFQAQTEAERGRFEAAKMASTQRMEAARIDVEKGQMKLAAWEADAREKNQAFLRSVEKERAVLNRYSAQIAGYGHTISGWHSVAQIGEQQQNMILSAMQRDAELQVHQAQAKLASWKASTDLAMSATKAAGSLAAETANVLSAGAIAASISTSAA